MDTTSKPSSSRRRMSGTYSRLFKPRPTAQKLHKRSSLPAATFDHKTAVTIQEEEVKEEKKNFQVIHRPKLSKRQSCAVQVQAVDGSSNFKTPPVKHQRHRSTSALVKDPSTRHDNLLKPVPPPPTTRRSFYGYTMSSVMGPEPSYAPYSYNAGFSSPNSYAMQRDSIARSVGPAYAQQAQRPSKLPPAMQGNYAQIDSRPAMYNRRASSGASSVASSTGSRDTFDAILASPASSRTSFDSWSSSPRRSDFVRQRPAPIKQYRQRREQGEILAALPEEVLGLILEKLRDLHLSPDTSSCATCMMRDLGSVAVSAKKLLRPAQNALYEDIQLVGADSQAQRKRYKLSFGSRLTLLRRTLRANPQLAVMVKSLKAPAVPQGVPIDLYQNLIASVVMACPNLERLVGSHQNYDHSFNRLFHALSTREQLTEMHWTLEASQFQTKRRMSNAAPLLNSSNPNFQEAPGDLHPQQSDDFLELHSNWINLTTLSIHCLPGATLTPVSLLPDIVSEMPALENLHLSHLPFTAFNDANLLSLPPLKNITLSHLPGISDEGLSNFARRPSSRSIRKLTLHHVNVHTLPTLSQILSNLTSMETFSIVQDTMPIMPENEMIWLFPYLSCPTLKKLHWDLTSQTSSASLADSILARSICTNGFPSVRTLRTPNDPDGIFQSLCAPVFKIERASDRYRGLIAKCASSSRPSPPATPTTPRTPSKSPGGMGLNFPMDDQLFPSKVSSNLTQSRLAAQVRLDAAWRTPRFTVNVIDDDGSVAEHYSLAGYMGQTESRIRYCLAPDAGAVDENGGLVEIADVLGDGGENLKEGREGCNGRWNTFGGVVVDKKDRDRWWHTERGRWTGVALD